MDRMNIKDASKYLGASEYKLREMVRKKEIPHYRIGNRIMFRKTKLDEWIELQEKSSILK